MSALRKRSRVRPTTAKSVGWTHVSDGAGIARLLLVLVRAKLDA